MGCYVIMPGLFSAEPEERSIIVKTDILLYVENGITDEDLTFKDAYVPEELAEKLKTLEPVDSVFFSVPEEYAGKLSAKDGAIIRKDNDDVEFWKELFKKTEAQHVIKICADAPFLDITVISEMLEVHCACLAEFTYSENLPQGLAGEIFSRNLIDVLPETEEKTLPLSRVIRSNMNHFDIELFYKDPDLRDKRISFRSSSRRDKKIMENVVSVRGAVPQYSELRDIIEKNPDVLYIGPSYVEVELSGDCQLDCVFCYRTFLDEPRGHMDAALFTKIVNDMRDFELPYTLCFGGSGEPLMHPGFYGMLDQALSEPLIERIIVETNGIEAGTNYATVTGNDTSGKIITIVNCNGYNRETYRGMHKSDAFDTVFNNVTALQKALGEQNSGNLYMQIMKIKETEPFLDQYYDFWEKHNIPIILQKQNTFLGLIEDRRYSDLSPLDRVPCWHLQRDLFITSLGEVPFCRVDVRALHASDRVSDQPLREIWNARQENYIQDYKGSYATAPDCRACDEWYTFNF